MLDTLVMGRLTYIIDGYNAIHRSSRWGRIIEADICRARESLCAYCASLFDVRKDIDHIIVVFDGDSSVSPFDRDSFRRVKIIYSQTGETADSVIVKVVEGKKDARDVVVISDDNQLRRLCRSEGASVMPVSEFAGLLPVNRPGPSPHFHSGKDDGLSPAEQNRITDELRQVWGID